LLVVASHQSGLNSVREIVQRSKDKPDSLNYVSSGVGGILHLATELFKQKAGIAITHVPYNGSGPAVIDLVAGRAEMFISTVPTILGQVQSKNVKLLGVTSQQRSPLFPDTPTLAEEGVAGLNLETWWGIVGPANIPADIVQQLNAAINEAAAAPAMRKRFEEEGATTFRGTGADFGAALKVEYDNWRNVAETGNLFTN
jgi:tripartite-type tricarboxylate transporter receptor subunit TctC